MRPDKLASHSRLAAELILDNTLLSYWFGGLVYVCYFVLLNQYWGIVTVLGFPRE